MAKSISEFKKRRESLLLTQEDVAAAMSVSVRTVANWDAGDGPSKRSAIEIERYFQEVANKRSGKIENVGSLFIPDRGFLLEVQIRNVLWQIAKDRARSAGEPENWKKYLEEIDADTPEVMKDLLDKSAMLKQ